MTHQKLKDEYGESKAEHFEDPYEYARYLERMGQKHETNLARRVIERRQENEII